MCSKADRSAVAIISVVQGAISVLLKQKRFSRVDMNKNLSALHKDVGVLRDTWSSNHTEKDVLWTLRQMMAWNTFLDEIGLSEELRTKILVKISLMATGDLLQKLSNRERKLKIERLYENLERIDEFIDPNGVAFESLDGANVILDSLYKEIGFA